MGIGRTALPWRKGDMAYFKRVTTEAPAATERRCDGEKDLVEIPKKFRRCREGGRVLSRAGRWEQLDLGGVHAAHH